MCYNSRERAQRPVLAAVSSSGFAFSVQHVTIITTCVLPLGVRVRQKRRSTQRVAKTVQDLGHRTIFNTTRRKVSFVSVICKYIITYTLALIQLHSLFEHIVKRH